MKRLLQAFFVLFVLVPFLSTCLVGCQQQQMGVKAGDNVNPVLPAHQKQAIAERRARDGG